MQENHEVEVKTKPEKLKCDFFSLKMIFIGSTAMMFSKICGKYTLRKNAVCPHNMQTFYQQFCTFTIKKITEFVTD